MSINVQHKGIQVNFVIDPATLTGDVAVDSKDSYIQSLVAGRLVTLDSDGYIQLCDGALQDPLGFLLMSADRFMENQHALAANTMAVTIGNCVVVTDQIDTALAFTPGERVYAGTSTKKGLVTNVPPYLGSQATGDLQSKLLITAVAGLIGNITVTVVDGTGDGVTAGNEVVTLANNVLTISIEDGVSTQTQMKTALEAHPLIDSVVPDNGGNAFTLAGDDTDSVALTGGLDGPRSIGIVGSAASAASPELQVIVGI